MKKIIIIVLVILSVSLISTKLYIDYTNNQKEQKRILKEEREKQKKEEHLKEIKDSYNPFVLTKKEKELYEFKDNEYVVVGKVSNKYKLELGEVKIDYDTNYFPIKGTNYYITYKDLDKIDNLDLVDTNYKKYVVFNENVILKKDSKMYRKDNSYISFSKELEFPIIIKDEDKYYFEYNNELYYVNKNDVQKTKKSNNTKEKTRNNIRVLTYHTIYNPKTETCTNTVICHPISQFDSHMKYLSDNNYFTLTMNDLELFLDKKIQIPKKSIVITLDDGKYAINAVNIVEKYKVNATYFMITSRHSVPNVQTTYMNFQAHTHDLHNNWKCAGGNQGGQLLCEKESVILEDLKKNKELIGGDVFAFAYPFFDYNDRAVKLLKQSGFRLAFIGQSLSDGYNDYKTNRYLLRRKTIFSTDSVETFKSRLA